VQNSVYKQLEKYIEKHPGEVIIPDDFRNLESESGVKTALMRLTKKGKIERLARGIYFSPKMDPLLGKVYPSIDDIAQKVATRDKATLRPTGIVALNRIGLSTQVPLKQVFLTDGAPRVLHIGKTTLQFKKASPRNLSYKGKISELIILALGELGSKNISDDMLNRIAELLRKENSAALNHDLGNAPRWIATLLVNLLKK
jgi:hypothetical protein